MTEQKNYTVYFELFGKKMRVKILAYNPFDAEQKVKSKITFHKTVIDKSDEFNQSTDIIDDIMNIITKKHNKP